MKKWIMAAGIISVSLLQAEPVKTQYLSPQAVWAVHLDLDLIRNAQDGLCAWLMEQTYEPETARKLAGAQMFLGFDLRQDLHNITIYGLTQDETSSVALLEGKLNVARLRELLDAADDHLMEVIDGYEIHSWSKKEDPMESSFAAFRGEDLLVFGSQRDVLVQALKQVDGSAAGAAAPGLLNFTQDKALLTAAFKSEKPLQWARAGMLKLANSGVFAIEESAGEIRVMMSLEVADEENAENIYRVAEGLRAMILFGAAQKPSAAELAKSVVTQKKERTISIALVAPSEQVVKVLREGVDLKKVKKAVNK
ncbi:MAG: hypothetical protein PHO37_11765 [Kiritimatiellae bacterium]|nr:hypothetical protein [Kiritimatiellia bacterium]